MNPVRSVIENWSSKNKPPSVSFPFPIARSGISEPLSGRVGRVSGFTFSHPRLQFGGLIRPWISRGVFGKKRQGAGWEIMAFLCDWILWRAEHVFRFYFRIGANGYEQGDFSGCILFHMDLYDMHSGLMARFQSGLTRIYRMSVTLPFLSNDLMSRVV